MTVSYKYFFYSQVFIIAFLIVMLNAQVYAINQKLENPDEAFGAFWTTIATLVQLSCLYALHLYHTDCVDEAVAEALEETKED